MRLHSEELGSLLKAGDGGRAPVAADTWDLFVMSRGAGCPLTMDGVCAHHVHAVTTSLLVDR